MDTFAEIYASKLFDRVRQINPNFQEQLLPFDLNLFLKPSSMNSTDEEEQVDITWRKLQNKIDLCFYIANNSVDFQEQNLKEMIQTNVMDLKRILTFLKTCTQLKSIVYLSSIYANIGKDSILSFLGKSPQCSI